MRFFFSLIWFPNFFPVIMHKFHYYLTEVFMKDKEVFFSNTYTVLPTVNKKPLFQSMVSKQKGLKIGLGEAGNKVRVRFFVGNTAWGCLTSATLPPIHTLTQMPKNLAFVVPAQKRLGTLPAVTIIRAWSWGG